MYLASVWRGLATAEMEHAENLTETSTNPAGVREKLRAKFAAKGATHEQVQLPPPLPLRQLPPPPRAQANAPRVLPLRPVERRHRHTTPFAHSVRVKSQVLTPLSTSTAFSKKSGALSASQLQEGICCVGIACCFVIFVLLLPVGWLVVTMQNGGPTRHWDPPSETVRDCRDDPSCRRDAHLPPLQRVNRTPLLNRTKRLYNAATQNALRRGLPARTPRAVGARLIKGPAKTPTIPTSNEHRALTGTSCTNPMRRDQSKSKQLPVIIFTHLRRTGGSVLERGVFWPGVACDQGVVPPPPPSPSPPRSVNRATPGGRLFYQAEVSNKPLPTLSARRAIQQARDSLLAAVLFNCHEGSVGRFASASVSERLKFASKMHRAALVWRHCPYGVHALLPGGKMATAQTVQTAQVAPHSSSSQVVQDRVQDLRARADGTDPVSLTWEQRMHERQLPKLLEPSPPKTFVYVTLLRDPVSQPPLSPPTLPLALSLVSRTRPRTRPRPHPRPRSRSTRALTLYPPSTRSRAPRPRPHQVERLMSWQAWCDNCARTRQGGRSSRDKLASMHCCGSSVTRPRQGEPSHRL